MQQTLSTLLPDVDDRAVVTDSFWMSDPDKGAEWLEIWLCEMESGGSGILIRLQQKWAEDPVSFLNVLVRNLSASDYEQIDYDLRTVLQMLQTDDALRMAISAVREANNMDARREANKNLHLRLSQRGLRLSHSFTTVLYSRILRAGSSDDTDTQLYQLLSDWSSLEVSAGIEFSMNTMAHALAVNALGVETDASVVFNAQCRNQTCSGRVATLSARLSSAFTICFARAKSQPSVCLLARYLANKSKRSLLTMTGLGICMRRCVKAVVRS
ncbi:helicase [Escherichia coli]|uniref:Helicase n=1 Tax=Escherichia coli TaxID=562 RepID=A0A485JL38_ECOLX|nr:helicase [Escherichia coli]